MTISTAAAIATVAISLAALLAGCGVFLWGMNSFNR